MTLITATALLYIACFAFYHAGKRRTAFGWVKAKASREKIVRYGGWIVAFAGLMVLVQAHGWELGIPLWLAVFVVAGTSSLLISALWPKTHLPSAVASAALLLFSGSYLVLGGMA